jgi:hypothetical protein
MTDENPPEQPGANPPGNKTDRRQDPIVERKRPDPSEPVTPTTTLRGFLGDSDRADWRRIYLSRNLDYYAEVRISDIVHIGTIPAEHPPFPGEEASVVEVRSGADITFTRSHKARGSDPFDLDIRLMSPAAINLGPEWIFDTFPCLNTPQTCQCTYTCVCTAAYTNCEFCE